MDTSENMLMPASRSKNHVNSEQLPPLAAEDLASTVRWPIQRYRSKTPSASLSTCLARSERRYPPSRLKRVGCDETSKSGQSPSTFAIFAMSTSLSPSGCTVFAPRIGLHWSRCLTISEPVGSATTIATSRPPWMNSPRPQQVSANKSPAPNRGTGTASPLGCPARIAQRVG